MEDILNEDNIALKKEINYYLYFWPIFLISILFFVVSGLLYLRYSSSIYNTTATVQIKKSSSDLSSFLTKTTQTFFGFEKVNVQNNIAIFKSNIISQNVIKKLDLRTSVYWKGRIKNSIIYGDSIPFNIKFLDDKSYDEILLTNNKDFATLKFEDSEILLERGNALSNDSLELNLHADFFKSENDYIIKRVSEKEALSRLKNSLDVGTLNKNDDNILISINGTNPYRNESIINSIIDEILSDQVRDKQRIFALSIEFIENRMTSIIEIIDSLNIKTTDFKIGNLLFTPELQTDNALSNIIKLEDESFRLVIQLDLSKILYDELINKKEYSLLPSNIGLENENINSLIFNYNELILKRSDLLVAATEINPIIKKINNQLDELRTNLLTSIQNFQVILQTSIEKFGSYKKKTESSVAEIPYKESELRSFARNFEIAEKLYLFLLEKKEEASISYISAIPNAKVVDYAYTSIFLVSPNKPLVLIFSLFTGFFLPFIIIFGLKKIDTKIHIPAHINELIPNFVLLGEVPFIKEIKQLYNPRSIIAESVRIIRSNISYIINDSSSTNGKVILCTSSLKSEGKTFVAFNVALSYAASAKKVIIIGADMRNPQIHNLINMDRDKHKLGLSSILHNKKTSIEDCVFNFKISEQIDMDFLLSGPIPPNPAELLIGDKFEKIISKLKLSYDYIIIDSAPLMLVSDTYSLLDYSDSTIYVIKSGVSDKNIGPFINNLIKDNKLKNPGFVLNSVKIGPASYYKYGYSYRYSYGYKYNYGYGYGYGEEFTN